MKEYQSAEIKELTTALVKAQAKIKHAEKSANNPFFKSKYADLPAVIDAAKPHLLEAGISLVQLPDTDDTGNAILMTQMTHISGQWMRSYYPVRPAKANDPQALGSAMTYARRYAYCAMTGVTAIGEDDDGNLASNVNVKPESAASRNRRFKAVLKAIEESNDPGTTWHEHLTEITEFKNDEYCGQESYDTLVMAGSKRKKELEQMASMKAGMPDDYNNIGAKQ